MTSSDLQKEWQVAADVKCTARMVQNRLWVELKHFMNEIQRRPRLRIAKEVSKTERGQSYELSHVEVKLL